MILALFLNCIKVKQRLGGVLIGTISTINNRDPAAFGKLGNRAGLRMAHGDNVGVTT